MLGNAVGAVLPVDDGEAEEEGEEEEGCGDECRECRLGIGVGGVAVGFVAWMGLTVTEFVWTGNAVEWIVHCRGLFGSSLRGA